MSLQIKVSRVPFFKAPRKPFAVWALNPCYCSAQGRKMIISRSLIDNHGYGIRDWKKVGERLQRMISDDNGVNWQEQGQEELNGPYDIPGNSQTNGMYFLDPETGFIISVFTKTVLSKGADARIEKVYYEISRDKGDTWSTAQQVIHPGKEYNTEYWMPGVTAGKQSIQADQAPFAKMEDGTIVCGFTFGNPSQFLKEDPERRAGVVFLRARWNNDKSDLLWDIGDVISAPEAAGWDICEPDAVHLGGQRLFTTMRTSGNEEKGIPCSRQCALSEDGGKTWGSPWTLKYDDGTNVFVPSSISAFERDPATGKVYWFANILDKPSYKHDPRDTISIAELDTKKLCLIKDSVTTIRSLFYNFREDDAARYSNFGHYVDRETGEFVLTVEEMFNVIRNYQKEDYCCFRVKILSGKK